MASKTQEAFLAPAAGTVAVIFTCIEAMKVQSRQRYAVLDGKGNKVLPHPYKPWTTHAGKEKEVEGAYLAHRAYENSREWATYTIPLLWLFSVYTSAIPYVRPPHVQLALTLLTAGYCYGNVLYVKGYAESAEGRLKGWRLRTLCFRALAYGAAAGIVYAGLMIFGLVGCIDCDWDPDAQGVEKLDLDALEADDDGGAGGEDEL